MNATDQGYYNNARREIEPLLPANIENVLEIGCGEGNTLLWLQHSGLVKSCKGIEILPDVASRGITAGLDIVVANIESEGIPFKEQYDLVLCLDVLEHLHDPWATMRVITDSIKPGGYFIASIPNISHISILSDLVLHDQWTYSEAGILDKTHLRFFTRSTTQELLSAAGLEILLHQHRFARKTHRNINFLTMGLFKRFLTFQNIFLARKTLQGHPYRSREIPFAQNPGNIP